MHKISFTGEKSILAVNMNQVFALILPFFVGLAFVNSQICQFDEVPVNCINECNTCQIQGICGDVCTAGCDCKQGLYRTSHGDCVSRSECAHHVAEFCPPNESFAACTGNCENDCKNKKHIECLRGLCVSECRCNRGFVRGPKGTCIKPEKCPTKDCTEYPVERVCPFNEHWNPSSAHCQENCTNLGKPPLCPYIRVGGCVCNEGLYRGNDGKCIPKNQCPKKPEVEFCPPNESFAACSGHCENDCKNKKQIDCRRGVCVSECKCNKGFVRGPKGTCIKPEKCPPKDCTKYPVKRVCPFNEHWNPSTAHCQKNCSNLCKPLPCPKISVAGCVCNKGFYRGKDGKCIPKDKCPKKQEAGFCPPNESFIACLGHCEYDCKNKTKISCARHLCVSECRCVKGFVRGPKGTCIKPKKCPPKDNTKYPVERVCPLNEHWNPSSAHCQENCTNLGKPLVCLKIAVAGCVCNKGLYRGKDGKCIPKNQCPKNEGRTFQVTHGEYIVLHEILDQDETLSQEETIVSAEFCPPNESFAACTGNCENDCKNKNRTFCSGGFCVSECKCIKGFVRGPNGTCIEPEKCPPNDDTEYPVERVCPSDEHWNPSTAHCQGNCTSKPPPCPKISVGGCVCNQGFLREMDGKCIPENECPKNGEDDLGVKDAFFNTDEQEDRYVFDYVEDEEEFISR